MFKFNKKRKKQNKSFSVNLYDGNNILVLHHHDIKYVYTTVDKNEDSHKDFIGLIQRDDDKEKKTLRVKTPAYFYYDGADLDVVHFPRVPNNLSAGGEIIQRAFSYDKEKNTFDEIVDKDKLNRLCELEIEFFYDACKRALITLNSKIIEAKRLGIPYKIVIPRTGATLLMQVFQKVFYFKVANSEIADVSYSGILSKLKHKNMEEVLNEEIEEALMKDKKGKYLIILDAAVSGTSLETIFESFKKCLRLRMGNFDRKEQQLRNILKKQLMFFFTEKVVKKGNKKFEFSETYHITMAYIRNGSPQERGEAIATLETNIAYLNDVFQKEFLPYLGQEKAREGATVYVSKKEEYLMYFNTIREIKTILEDIKEKHLSGAHHGVMIDTNALDNKIKLIIHTKNGHSLMAIALGRRVYEEWMGLFNLRLFFVIVRDTKSLAHEDFKEQDFYKEIFQRFFGETFSCLGIPTEDIISSRKKEELLKKEFVEYYEEIGRDPEIREILNVMRSYKDKYDSKFKLEQ